MRVWYLLATSFLLLVACSPVFNWREVRFEAAPLQAMLPCKPDNGEKTVALGGRNVAMQMLGCEAGGSLFALASVDPGDPTLAGAIMAQWKAATLGNVRASKSIDTRFVPAGALGLAESLHSAATGVRPDGSAVQVRAAWFAQGSRVYQAAIFADNIDVEAADTFFSSLRLP